MTERQKKILIIGGTIIIGLILLLGSKRTGGTIINQGQAPNFNVTIPSLNLPSRTGYPINIPGLPNFTPYQFSPISPCMCNGAGNLQMPNTSPAYSVTNITNLGASGPNIYNYAASRTSSGGLGMAVNVNGNWVTVS